MKPDQAIQQLWRRVVAAGIEDPLTAAEQIAYLVLLRRMAIDAAQGRPVDASDVWRAEAAATWRKMKKQGAGDAGHFMEQTALPALRRLAEGYGERFHRAMHDAAVDLVSGDALAEAIELVDATWDEAADRHGELFAQLLVHAALSGREGQVLTPPALVDAMVTLTAPAPADVVVDPAAGTASLLVAATEYAQRLVVTQGLDTDPAMVRLGATNLLLHGHRQPWIDHGDGLEYANASEANVVLCHPPFSGRVDDDDERYQWLGAPTNRVELLFLALCGKLLEPDGRCAVVLPLSAVSDVTTGHRAVRESLLAGCRVTAVAALPRGIFRPYADVRACVVAFAAGPPTELVWFTDLAEHREGVAALVAARRALDHSGVVAPPSGWWAADLDQIATNDMRLDPDAYRAGREAVSSAEPRVILQRVRAMEEELLERLTSLERRLRG